MFLRSIATLVGRAAFLTICLCLSVNLASAATATWDGGGGDNNFRSPANWTGDIAPSPGDILAFDGEVRLTPNNNYVAGTQFGGITFTPTVAGPFTLNGNGINLNGNITDSTQAFTNTINLPLALQVTPTVNIAKFGSLAISGNISGSFGLNETGNGLLTLSGGNTFTGPITVGNGATLAVATDSNLGAAPSSPTAGKLTLSGGSQLSITGTTTINANRGIALVGPTASTINVPATNSSSSVNVTYGGSIADGGSAGALSKIGFGTLTLAGQSSYTGATTVGNGTLNLDFGQATAPSDGTNIIYHSVTPGNLTLGGASAGLGNNSLAQLVVTGKSATTSSQSFASTTLQFGMSIIQSNNNGGTANISLGNITDNPGGAVVFVPSTTGATNTFSTTTTVATTAGILGGWATIGNSNAGNFNPPGGFGFPSVNFPLGTNWATVDGTGKIVPYAGYTNYAARIGADTGPVIAAGILAPNVTANTNLKIAGGTNAVPVIVDANHAVGAGSTTNINTVAISGSVNGDNMVIGVGNTLRLGQYGGFFKQDTATGITIFVGGHGSVQTATSSGLAADGVSDQDEGILTAGPATGGPGQIVVTANNASSESTGTIIFESKITDNPAGGAVSFVKAGSGSMKLGGHNSYSGGTYILQGRVQLTGTELAGTANSTQVAQGLGTLGTAMTAANLSNPGGFGTGPVYIFPGAQVFPSGINSANGIIPNNFFFAGSGFAAENDGAYRLGGGLNLTGTQTLIGDGMIAGAGVATISGQITGGFNLTLGTSATINTSLVLANTNTTNAAPGTVSGLVSTNNWTGNTSISTGTGGARTVSITLGANEQIPSGVGFGNLIINDAANGTAAGGVVTLFLNGYNQSVNGLSSNFNTAANAGSTTAIVITNAAANGVTPHTGNSLLTVGGNNQTAAFNGVISDGVSGTISLTKIGTGVQTLGGINTYSGPTIVTNGALSVTGSLNAGGTVALNTSATASGSLYGTGSLGTLTTAAAVGSQNAIINPGAKGAGTFGTLTMASATIGGGTDLQFDLQNAATGASDQLGVGSLSLGSQVTVSPSGTPVAGDYTVIQSSSSITGSALALNTANDTRLTFAFAPSSWNPGTNANSQTVVIRVSGQSAHLLWSGTADATTWDLKTTQNWKNSDNANATDKFFNGDFVTFDDTGAPNFNISLGGTVQPGSITVNNSAGDYTITGGGSITGGGTLVKNGSRALTISTNNSYSGGATLSAGTLNVNNNGALGAGALTINGGILGNTSGQTVTLVSNPAQNWNADITFNGPSDLNLGTGAVTSTVTGGTVRTVTVNGGTLTVGGTITDTAGTDGLTKAGAGTLVLGAANNFSGPVNINGGTVKVNDFGALGTNATPGTTIATGATLDVGGFGAANVALGFGAMPFSIAGTGVGGAGAIINSGINAQQNAFQNISLSADATVGGTGRFDIRGGTPVLNLNGRTLTKIGTNQFSIVGAAVNSGNIVVNQGTLSIETATSIDNTVPTDTITINPGATLQFFANSGTVSRPIVINGDNVTINDGSGAAAVSTIASPIAAKGNLTFTGGNATANLIMNGAITESGGARSLTKSGASQLTLGATTNTYTGGTNLNGGVVTFSALGSLGTGPLRFSGGTLQYGSTATGDVSTLGITVNQGGGTIDTNGNVVALSKNITGPGGFGVKGNSTVLLTGTNTYAGPTTVQNGFLIVGSDGAIPNNTSLVLGNANSDNATFDLNGRSLNVSGLTTVGNSSGNLTSGGPGNLTVTYNGTSAGDTFNANISNGTAQSIALALNSGQLSLGGSNSYTGTTKVNNSAKLFVNGSHFGGGAYTVASGATLGGIGSTDAAVTVASGGTLSPGAASGLGTLTVGSATIAGTLQIRINDADTFLNGSLTTNAALALQSATLNFNITGGAFQPVYLLAHYGSLTGNPFANVVGLPANYTLNYNYLGNKNIALVSNFPAIQTGDFNRDGHTNASDVQAMLQALTDVKTYQTSKSMSSAQLLQVGDFNADGAFNNLDMQSFLAYISVPANNNVAPVPEPTSLALLALGGLCLAGVCRRCGRGASGR